MDKMKSRKISEFGDQVPLSSPVLPIEEYDLFRPHLNEQRKDSPTKNMAPMQENTRYLLAYYLAFDEFTELEGELILKGVLADLAKSWGEETHCQRVWKAIQKYCESKYLRPKWTLKSEQEVPNRLMAAVCCDTLEKVGALYADRLGISTLFDVLKASLFRCVYADYHEQAFFLDLKPHFEGSTGSGGLSWDRTENVVKKGLHREYSFDTIEEMEEETFQITEEFARNFSSLRTRPDLRSQVLSILAQSSTPEELQAAGLLSISSISRANTTTSDIESQGQTTSSPPSQSPLSRRSNIPLRARSLSLSGRPRRPPSLKSIGQSKSYNSYTVQQLDGPGPAPEAGGLIRRQSTLKDIKLLPTAAQRVRTALQSLDLPTAQRPSVPEGFVVRLVDISKFPARSTVMTLPSEVSKWKVKQMITLKLGVISDLGVQIIHNQSVWKENKDEMKQPFVHHKDKVAVILVVLSDSSLDEMQRLSDITAGASEGSEWMSVFECSLGREERTAIFDYLLPSSLASVMPRCLLDDHRFHSFILQEHLKQVELALKLLPEEESLIKCRNELDMQLSVFPDGPSLKDVKTAVLELGGVPHTARARAPPVISRSRTMSGSEEAWHFPEGLAHIWSEDDLPSIGPDFFPTLDLETSLAMMDWVSLEHLQKLYLCEGKIEWTDFSKFVYYFIVGKIGVVSEVERCITMWLNGCTRFKEYNSICENALRLMGCRGKVRSLHLKSYMICLHEANSSPVGFSSDISYNAIQRKGVTIERAKHIFIKLFADRLTPGTHEYEYVEDAMKHLPRYQIMHTQPDPEVGHTLDVDLPTLVAVDDLLELCLDVCDAQVARARELLGALFDCLVLDSGSADNVHLEQFSAALHVIDDSLSWMQIAELYRSCQSASGLTLNKDVFIEMALEHNMLCSAPTFAHRMNKRQKSRKPRKRTNKEKAFSTDAKEPTQRNNDAEDVEPLTPIGLDRSMHLLPVFGGAHLTGASLMMNQSEVSAETTRYVLKVISNLNKAASRAVQDSLLSTDSSRCNLDELCEKLPLQDEISKAARLIIDGIWAQYSQVLQLKAENSPQPVAIFLKKIEMIMVAMLRDKEECEQPWILLRYIASCILPLDPRVEADMASTTDNGHEEQAGHNPLDGTMKDYISDAMKHTNSNDLHHHLKVHFRKMYLDFIQDHENVNSAEVLSIKAFRTALSHDKHL